MGVVEVALRLLADAVATVLLRWFAARGLTRRKPGRAVLEDRLVVSALLYACDRSTREEVAR